MRKGCIVIQGHCKLSALVVAYWIEYSRRRCKASLQLRSLSLFIVRTHILTSKDHIYSSHGRFLGPFVIRQGAQVNSRRQVASFCFQDQRFAVFGHLTSKGNNDDNKTETRIRIHKTMDVNTGWYSTTTILLNVSFALLRQLHQTIDLQDYMSLMLFHAQCRSKWRKVPMMEVNIPWTQRFIYVDLRLFWRIMHCKDALYHVQAKTRLVWLMISLLEK